MININYIMEYNVEKNTTITNVSNTTTLNIDNHQQEYHNWNENSIYSKKVGKINEVGTIRNLSKKGFTFHQCLSELVANSIDATSLTCLFDINLNSINIIDDGNGMNYDNLDSMFDLNRESHRNQEKIGICGVGAKASLLILSNKSWCNVYTYTINGKYLKASLDWNDILEKKCWTNMISIVEMNDTEIKQFKNERIERNLKPVGTTIQFPYTLSVNEAIKAQFDINIKTDPNILFPLRERLDIIYGYIPNFEIKLVSYDNPLKIEKMGVYSPFKLDNKYYYDGKTKHIIKVMKNDNDTFDYICNIDGVDKYIETTDKTTKKELKVYNQKETRGKHIGDFEFIIGVYRDNKYFNSQNPVLPKESNTDFNEYDEKMFGNKPDKTRKSEISQTPIIRNNHYIGGVPIKKFTTTDGGGPTQIKTTFKTWRCRSVLKYYTKSSHDNDMDNIVNIQENKQQYNSFSFPLNLKRLLDKLIDIKCENVWTYFEELCERVELLNYDILKNINPSEYQDKTILELREYITNLQNIETNTKLKLYQHPILQNKTLELYNTLSLNQLQDYIETEEIKNDNLKKKLIKNPILNDISKEQYSNIYLAEELKIFIQTKENEEYNNKKELYKNPILIDIPDSNYRHLSYKELQKYIQQLDIKEKDDRRKIIDTNPIINTYPLQEWENLTSKQLLQYIIDKDNITKMSNKREELLREKILNKYPPDEYSELSIDDLQNYINEKIQVDKIINENIDLLNKFEPFEYDKLSPSQLSHFINSKNKIIQLIDTNKVLLTYYGEEKDYKNLDVLELEEYITNKTNIKILLKENIDKLTQYGYQVENYKNIKINELQSSIKDMNLYNELIDKNKDKLHSYPPEKYKNLQQLKNLLYEINKVNNQNLDEHHILKRCPKHEWNHLRNDRHQLDNYIDTKKKELDLLDDLIQQKKQLYNKAKKQLSDTFFLDFKNTKPI